MRTGLHVHGVGDPAKILDYYRRSQSKCFKVVSARDGALFDQLKAMGVTIIHRVYVERQELGGQQAKDFLARVVESVRLSPQIDFEEGYNEAFSTPDEIGRYAEFEIERMRALERVGRKAMIGNFSQGTPALPDDPDPVKRRSWELFRPALEHALRYGHALGLHEYAGPYMQWGTRTPDGRNQWDHGRRAWTGATLDPSVYRDPSLTGYHTLRYRLVYRQLREWGLGALPLFITEGGIDDTTPRPGGQGRGYKSWRSTEWARLPGIGDYAEQRAWYMWQVSHDPSVRGVVDFGWDGTATGWEDFDMANDPATVDRVIAAESGLPIGHFHSAEPTPPPAPPTPPAPPPAPPTTGAYAVVDYSSAHSSPRGGAKVEYLVLHSTDSPVGSLPASTARYLQQNAALASAHELVTPGMVYRMVPDDRAAHHAGYSTLPGGRTGMVVNQVTWGIEVFQEHGKPCAPVLVQIAVERIVAAARRFGLGAAAVLGHREIDPGRRSDPVGVDMNDLRARVAAALGDSPRPRGVDIAKLAAAAKSLHEREGIRLNPGSSLQRTVLADGLIPTTNESTAEGVTFLRAESFAAGVWIYWWNASTGRVNKAKVG